MTAATVRLSWYGGSASEPAGVDVETVGITLARADAVNSNVYSQGVPAPLSGTTYSWPLLVALEVTTPGTTSLSNRRVQLPGGVPAGIYLYAAGLSAYAQPSSAPADGAGNGDVPSGYTLLSGSAVTYAAGSQSAASAGRNGDFCALLLGVAATYRSGGGAGGVQTALGTLQFQYDES